MISEFNRGQMLRGMVGLAGGAVCYALVWLFLREVTGSALHVFGFPREHAVWLAWAGLGVTTFSGWRTWQDGRGFQSYAESAFYHDLGGDSGTMGGHVVDLYSSRYSGLAYVLSQAFLCGPLLLLKNVQRLRKRVPEEAELEQKLTHLLGAVTVANKWQGLADYPGQEREVLLLGLMKKIDFSQYKGRVRFKAKGAEEV